MQEIGKDELENPRNFGAGAETTNEPEEEWNTDEGEPATEDEQQDYDLLVIRAQKIMFGDGREKILTLLGSGESPAKSIGQAESMLIKSLRQSAKEQGRDISDEIALNAGAEIGEDLSELAKSAGVFKYDSEADELQELEDAMLWGVKLYGDGMIQSGEITPEIQQAAAKVTQENNQREYDGAPKPPKPKKNKVGDAVRQGIDQGDNTGIINGAMPQEGM